MDLYAVLGIVSNLFFIYQIMIFVYILMSWVPALQQSFVGEFLGKLVEPYLGIFRRFIPPLGMIDISPIIAIFALNYIGRGLLIVLSNLLG
jgi:YggT family protein